MGNPCKPNNQRIKSQVHENGVVCLQFFFSCECGIEKNGKESERKSKRITI